MTHLRLFLTRVLEGFQKTIFWFREHRQPPKPSAGAAEPSHETRSLAQILRGPVQKLRSPDQPTEIDIICRSPDQIWPARFTEIAPLCRSPAPSTRSPASQQRSPVRTLRSPVAPHAREVALKSARGAVLGFGVSTQKPREVILNPGGGQYQNCEAQTIWPISLKKKVSNIAFYVQASRKWAQTLGDSTKTAKPNAILVDLGTSAEVP